MDVAENSAQHGYGGETNDAARCVLLLHQRAERRVGDGTRELIADEGVQGSTGDDELADGGYSGDQSASVGSNNT